VNPNSVSSSTHVVHILAVAGSLMLLIGSAGQAWESVRVYQDEFRRFAHELGVAFTQRDALVVEVGRRLSQFPQDEVMATPYVLTGLLMIIFLSIRQWRSARIEKRRASITQDPKQETADVRPLMTQHTKQETADVRLRSLLRTALNWFFIMFGSIAVLIGATIDLIASW
jgi:hypothetical protein